MIPTKRGQKLVSSHCLPGKLKLVENPLQTQNDTIVTCKLKDCSAQVAQCKQRLKHAIHVTSSALIYKTVVLQSGYLFKAGVYTSLPAVLSLKP